MKRDWRPAPLHLLHPRRLLESACYLRLRTTVDNLSYVHYATRIPKDVTCKRCKPKLWLAEKGYE